MHILQNLVQMTGQRDHLRLEFSVLSTFLQLPSVTNVRALELLQLDDECWVRPRTWLQDDQLVTAAKEFVRAQALAQLQAEHLAYPCACTRKDLEQLWLQQGQPHERHLERPYPGTCRTGLHNRPARSWRFAMHEYISNWPQTLSTPALQAPFSLENGVLTWQDRRLGIQHQAPAQTAGDFVLQRADHLYAYQLAVVVDDAQQGVTHVVRGEDLADNTARQLLLQHALGLPHPHYLHTPLVRMPDGEKLSKQHGAPALDLSHPMQTLNAAANSLHLPTFSPETSISDALAQWVNLWQATYNTRCD